MANTPKTTKWKQYRLVIILASLIVVALIFSIANRLVRKDSTDGISGPTPTTTSVASAGPSFAPSFDPTPNATSSPTASSSLQTTSVFYPSIDGTNRTLHYYDFTEGTLRRLNLETADSATLSEPFHFINRVVWSPNRETVVLFLENGQGNIVENPLYQEDVLEGETLVGLYSIKTKKFKRLNDHIVEIAFIGNNSIIYQYRNGEINNLSIAKADGTDWKNIKRLNGESQIINMGESALVQEAGEAKITRYEKTGKAVENMSLLADLQLARSSWSGNNAVYLVERDNQLIIKQFKSGAAIELYKFDGKPEQSAILWDNVTNEIYLASYDGLVKLPVKAQP